MPPTPALRVGRDTTPGKPPGQYPAPPARSLLTELMTRGRGGTGSGGALLSPSEARVAAGQGRSASEVGAPQRASPAAAGLPPSTTVHLKLYSPSKHPVKLSVLDTSTVYDVINAALRMARTRAVPDLPGDARCYELRLHDKDGVPDDDFPPLDKTRRIRNFVRDDQRGNEFCLRVLPGPMSRYKDASPWDGSVSGGPVEVPPGASPLPASVRGTSLSRVEVLRSGSVGGSRRPPVLGGDGGAPMLVGRGSVSITPGGGAPLTPLPGSGEGSSSAAAAASSAAGPVEVRVVVPASELPHSGGKPSVTNVPLREETTARDVLESVARKSRLPIFYERWVVRVGPSDAARLGMPSRELPLGAPLWGLGLEVVELVRRAWADVAESRSVVGVGGRVAAPPPLTTRGRPGRPELSQVGLGIRASPLPGTTPGGAPGTLMVGSTSVSGRVWAGSVAHLPTSSVSGGAGRGSGGGAPTTLAPTLAASTFKEWEVTKVNRHGKRQGRLLGVDSQRITNRKVEKRRYFSGDATTHAERPIASIVRVFVPNGAKNSFSITFKEEVAGGHPSATTDLTVWYEARNGGERDEIMARLGLILRQRGQSYKLERGDG